MSIGEFYLHKAEQCERLSAAAADPAKRASLREEGRLWRQIAGDIINQDKADKAPP